MTARKRRSAQVPAQFLGYSLQTTRAAIRLLQSEPGSVVSVEVLDDIAVTGPNGGTTAEQSKSVTSGNPIADRSVELWKTFANWIRAAEAGQIDPSRTSFEIFLSRRRPGTLANLFANAADRRSAELALGVARQALWGMPPKFPKRVRMSATLAPHVGAVFTARDGLAPTVIERFSLVFGSGSSKNDLLNVLKTALVPVDMLEAVAHQALGWVKSTLDSCIERSRPAVIAVDEFRSELTSFVHKYDRFAILNASAPAPSQTSLDLELRDRIYVQQLDIIGTDYEAKLRAANDYLRASIDRTVWATKGLVHRSSFNEFEDVLTRQWRAKKEIVSIQSKGQPPDICGRLLFSECSLLQSPLEGRSVPPYFTPGCYHALADRLAVGWHPEFKTVLATAEPGSKDPAA
jgi:hypothetical protein